MRKKLVPATIAGVLLALLAVACKNSVSNPPLLIPPEEAEPPIPGDEVTADPTTFTEQPAQATLVLQDESAVLSCTADGETVTYQWYEAADSKGNSGTPIALATERTLSTPAFSAPGIRYYYCVASAGDMSEKSRVAAVACTGLPTLYLDLDRPLASVTKDDYALGKMRIAHTDGTEFEYEFTKSGKEGIKGRGNSSWNMEKKGYNIKLDKKQGLFGLPKAKKWCIVANHSDKTLLRNKFASVLGNDVLGKAGGEWNPRFVSVDVVVNGEYRGNYLFGERITLTEGRVDVPDITEAADLSDGGFILEVDSRLDAEFTFKTDLKAVPFTLKDPDEVGADVQAHIMRIVNTAESALYGDSFADVADGWRNYLDEASFIDWFIVNEFAKNNDAIFHTSVYMYYNPADGKLHMGPNWDFDIGFGNVNYNGCDDPTGWWIKGAKWIARLFEDEAFVANLKNRWNEVKPAISMKSNTELRALAAANSVSAELNFARWQILGKYVWPNPAGYERRTTYQSEVDWMADWLERRYNWLDSAINGL